jgi:hypothetical protein
MIDVAMPVQAGRFIPMDVLVGLLLGGEPFRLIVSTAYPSNLANARNHAVQYAESQWVLMLDNDCIIPPKSLTLMRRFLEVHSGFGAIAIAKFPSCVDPYLYEDNVSEPDHVDMSCVLWRQDVLRQIRFRTEESVYCDCLPACRDVRALNKRIGFLPKIFCRHQDSMTSLGLAQGAVREIVSSMGDPERIQSLLLQHGQHFRSKKNPMRSFLSWLRIV